MHNVIQRGISCLLIALTVFSAQSFAEGNDSDLSEITSITGQIQVFMADNFETGVSKREFGIRVKQPDGDYRLFDLSFDAQPEMKLKSGDTILARGRLSGNSFVADSIHPILETKVNNIQNTADAVIYEEAPRPAGTRNAVVLIVTIDGIGATHTIANPAAALYTGSQNVKDFYEYSSYGQLSFEPDTNNDNKPDIFGPFAIKDEGAGGNACRKNQWANAADKAALEAGVKLSLYQHRIYLLPKEAPCSWAGYAQVGCNDEKGCPVWIREGGAPAIAHELGHNLGWRHASYDNNGDGMIDKFDKDEEYGDASCIMGYPNWSQANAPHRDQFGWFDDYSGALVEANCSDTFELHPLESHPDNVGTQVVKIPIPDSGDFYYLSFRKGINPYPSNSNYSDRINIHRYAGRGRFRTIHITNLDKGETFEDTDHNITVRWPQSNGSNNSDYATAVATVEVPNTSPVAKFSYKADHLEVAFNDMSHDNLGSIEFQQWDFGDGNTSEEVDPNHTYEKAGTYAVKLTVTDNCGNSNTITQSITVELNQGPTADFSFTINQLDVTFNDASNDSDGDIVSHQWQFGDGDTSDKADPKHTYKAGGTYSVTLTITDDDGAQHTSSQDVSVSEPSTPAANFKYIVNGLSVEFTDTSTGNLVSRSWDLGDGASSAETNPSHTYSADGIYTVTLTAKDELGESYTSTQSVTVEAPIAPSTLTADYTYIVNGRSVTFKDTSSGTIESRKWDFGDGETSDQFEPSHTYPAAGTYSAILSITDPDGKSHTVTKNISVTDNLPPTADFEFVIDGMTIIFKQTSADTDGAVHRYHWDFGDGVTSSDPDPEHKYDEKGEYTVRLTVADNEDAESSAEKVISLDDNVTKPKGSALTGGGGGGGGGCFIRSLY